MTINVTLYHYISYILVLGLFHQVWWWLVCHISSHPSYSHHFLSKQIHIYRIEQFYYYVHVYVPNCAYSLFTYTYFINTGRDVLVSQNHSSTKTKRIRLEQVPSVGIENPRFLLWNSFPGAPGDTVGFGDRGAVCSQAVQSGGRNRSRKGATGGQRCVCLSDFE